MGDESAIALEICQIGARMYEKGLVSATDGNISVRLSDGRILCTPSGSCLGMVTPDELVEVDLEGKVIRGSGRVTSEFPLHRACYRERADIVSVIHAHPPRATGFTLAGVALTDPLLPELVFSGGGVPTAPYATPGSAEGAVAVGPLIRECDTLMLDRHGSVTVGASLLEAYFRLDKLEHGAESLFTAWLLGGAKVLSADEVGRIRAARAAYGAKGKYFSGE